MEIKINDGGIVAAIRGEIDHHNAATLRKDLDEAILEHRPKRLVLDFSGVSFMDSSGIGLVMGRYRTLSEWGGGVCLRGLSESQKKVMKMAGMQKIAIFEEKSKGEQADEANESNEVNFAKQVGQ